MLLESFTVLGLSRAKTIIPPQFRINSAYIAEYVIKWLNTVWNRLILSVIIRKKWIFLWNFEIFFCSTALIHWDREKVGLWGRSRSWDRDRDRDRQRPIIFGLETGTGTEKTDNGRSQDRDRDRFLTDFSVFGIKIGCKWIF